MKGSIEKGYHGNGKLWYETPYHRGKVHGVDKTYYDNGKLHYERPYHQGKIHGVEKWYYRSGDGGEFYYLYGEEVSREEYRLHELTEQLSGINQ